jgi:hypothetical protein
MNETDESKEEGMRLNVKERFAGLAASSGFNHDAPEPPLELSSLMMFQRPEQCPVCYLYSSRCH